jgi:peptide deformylase
MGKVVNLELVEQNSPILRTVLEPFDFSNPPVDPDELAFRMVECMRKNKGLGLSANQVGLPYRMFVLEGEPAYACFNPRVVDASDEEVLLEEGCLSYPGLIVKVKRPRHLKVRFTGPNGETHTMKFTGMTARAYLHEYDHLQGKIFYTRANLTHRDRAMREWKKYNRRVKNEHIQNISA